MFPDLRIWANYFWPPWQKVGIFPLQLISHESVPNGPWTPEQLSFRVLNNFFFSLTLMVSLVQSIHPRLALSLSPSGSQCSRTRSCVIWATWFWGQTGNKRSTKHFWLWWLNLGTLYRFLSLFMCNSSPNLQENPSELHACVSTTAQGHISKTGQFSYWNTFSRHCPPQIIICRGKSRSFLHLLGQTTPRWQ